MTDYTELKRLAEDFPADLDWDSNTEPFFNGLSGESLGGGSTGFYSVYGQPFEIDGDTYDGNEYVPVCTKDFAKFVCSARDGVLALIAENDSQRKDLQNLRADNAQLLYALKQEEQSYLVLRAERDQLKAENEALRKDAERYQWLRSRESAADPEISVTRWNQISPDHAMGDAPRLEVLDAAIDAAMGNGEKS